MPFICSACGKLYSIPPDLSGLHMIQKNLELLIQKYSRLAFWGIGPFFRDLMNSYTFGDESIYLVDSKNNQPFNGRTVLKPEYIGDLNINLVIVSARTHSHQPGPATAIAKAAAAAGIQYIVSLREMAQYDFKMQDQVRKI